VTICVALKVRDCIVFGADSATTVSTVLTDGTSKVTNVWGHGVKVFNLHKGLPIVAMTCGSGNIGSQSISNIAKDFRLSISQNPNKVGFDPKSYQIEHIAKLAFEFFKVRFDAAKLPDPNDHYFEFLIGGYDSDEPHGEVWKICYSENALQKPELIIAKNNTGNVYWSGQTQVLQRLILGYDARIATVLKDSGLPERQVNALLQTIKDSLATPLVCDTMPVIDAIQLTRYLVNVTKGYFKYLPGADVVGGETEIATVTRHEGFKWINRKHYYPADLNLKETDHV